MTVTDGQGYVERHGPCIEVKGSLLAFVRIADKNKSCIIHFIWVGAIVTLPNLLSLPPYHSLF